MTAIHLVRGGCSRVVIIEPSAELARGATYRTDLGPLELNVPASNMSAWPNDPDDFWSWLKHHQPEATPHTFAPRALYGHYLVETIEPHLDNLCVLPHRAVDIQRDHNGFSVTLADHSTVKASHIVLALGNNAPRELPFLDGDSTSSRVLNHPLTQLHQLTPRQHDRIAIVGTGLTALDVIRWLDHLGHTGPIMMLSRHGLEPRPHVWPAPNALPELPDELRINPQIQHLFTWLRDLGKQLAAQEFDESRAVDALRPVTIKLWKNFNLVERRRFLRHARIFWDIYRHRASPDSYAAYLRGRHTGRIQVQAGHLIGYHTPAIDKVSLTFRRRGNTHTETIVIDWLLNCTGPERDLTRSTNPLVQTLLTQGLLCPDELRLGARTGHNGELLDTQNCIVPNAYVVGPWRIADLWESVAVPELRHQAAQVAATILSRQLRTHLDQPSLTPQT